MSRFNWKFTAFPPTPPLNWAKFKTMLTSWFAKIATSLELERHANRFVFVPSILLALTGAGTLCLLAQSVCCASDSHRAFFEGECFALVLVNAPSLDFADFSKCRKSLRRSYLRSSRTFGHVWLVLVDRRSGLLTECGYTGETSSELPGYFDGVKQLVQGRCSSKMASLGASIDNPIGYLMLERDDGQLQLGSGGHQPTCAWGIPLTRCQLKKARQAMRKFPKGPFHLARLNCTSFVQSVMGVCGVHLNSRQDLQVPRIWRFQDREITLWNSAEFATLKLSTPDAMQKSILSHVDSKEISLALSWYASLH